MHTPKARINASGGTQKTSPRSSSSEVTQKNSSPQAVSADLKQRTSPRVVRQLKSNARYTEHTASSSNLASRAPKEESPKVASRKSPITESTRPIEVSELECQVSQLEIDLKTVKDQLCSAEALKKLAKKDAEESNQQLLALSLKLDESQKQIIEHSATEEVNSMILREALGGHNLDMQSELDTVKKQYSDILYVMDSASNEIKQLKFQHEMIAASETTQTKFSASAQAEICMLRKNLEEALLLLEDMKNQLIECKESEAQAQELNVEALKQLETVKKVVENLRLDAFKTMETYGGIAAKLDQSKAHAQSLEELVSKLKVEVSSKEPLKKGLTEESVNAVLISVKAEAEQLRSALEVTERKYSEEHARSSEQLRTTFEILEEVKSASSQRESGLELELRKCQFEIEELKANLIDKETELQGICEENEELSSKLEKTLSGHRGHELENELQKSKADVEDLKARVMDRETEWQNVTEENKMLKMELQKMSNCEVCDKVVSDDEADGAAEKDILFKIAYLTDEVDKSNRRAARVSEQLEAVQVTNVEMETELRRLKVQSDQWRKAAEAAAAMLSMEKNGYIMGRTGSMDSNYSPRMGKLGSTYADDFSEDLLKKKNANMLRRFGVLWKKPQK